MNIACFYLPNFPLQTEWQRYPDLRGRQVIIVTSAAPARQEVLDFTPGMRGLQPGMPLQEALSRSKGALLLEADIPHYYEIFESVLKVLENCGPSVEGAELGCAYMDLTGLEKMYGGNEGLKKALIDAIPPPFIARVGIGRGKFPARAALSGGRKKKEERRKKKEGASPRLEDLAQSCAEGNYPHCLSREGGNPGQAAGGLVVAGLQPAGVGDSRKKEERREEKGEGRRSEVMEIEGDAADFLKDCAIDILPAPWKMKQRLHSFGLHTLGQIAGLPLGPLQAQFGPEGKKIWDLARGIDNSPLIPRGSEETVSVYLSFPGATGSQGVIFLAVEGLLRQAFARSELRDRFARGVLLQGHIPDSPSWERRITFREPVGDKNRVLFIIKSAMDGVALPGPLEDLRLILFGLTGQVGRQESFFSEVRRREQLSEILRQLETRLGKAPPIYQVRSLEPWSKIPERRQALVRFSP